MRSEAQSYAINQIEKRRQDALLASSVKNNEVSVRFPTVMELTLQLQATSAQLSTVIFSGGNDVKQKIDKIIQKNLKTQEMIKAILVQNNYPEDYLDIHYTCPLCDDSGYVDGIRCSCFKKLVTEYNIKAFNANTKISKNICFDNFSLDYYSNKKAENGISDRAIMSDILENCKQYSYRFSENSKSVLMLGETGLGKTHMSLSIANEVMKNGFNTFYVSAPDLFRKLQNEYYGKTENGVDTMETLQNASLIIIDDLGAEIENQFVSSSLYNIINMRLNSEKPTIISTNLKLKELEKRYTTRVTSRIMTLYRCLKFVGKDIRMLKLKENI